MMDFISQHFVDVRLIEGGLQLNLSYAMVVISAWLGSWSLKRTFSFKQKAPQK